MPAVYQPRAPPDGVLHELVRTWWPRLLESVEADDGTVPGFVRRAVERNLVCGDPRSGFIHMRCPDCGLERALPFSCKGRGLCPSCGARRSHDVAHHLVERVLPDVPIRQYVLSPPSELVGVLAARGEALSALSRIFTEAIFERIGRRLDLGKKPHCGAITFVQRFSKTLSCYPHLHVLVLDGAYVQTEDGGLDFVDDPGPLPVDVAALEDEVLTRFERWLRRHGYLDDEAKAPEDDDAWWLAAAQAPSGVVALAGDKKRKKPAFEVHAKVRVRHGDKVGRQQLVRYVTRPPFAEDQLEFLDDERVRVKLRSPLRNGQEQIILHPLALLRRLTWLIPPPRQHQIRYAGVLAPAAALRPVVVPAGRISVQGALFPTDRAFEPLTPEPYRVAWAQLLARVYDVDAQACPACPGRLKPVGAVLPPHAATWVDTGRIYPVGAMAPPMKQLSLAFAS